MKFHTFYTVPLILTFVFVWHARAEGSSLVFVNVVWRHGARSTLHSFPNDPYNAQKQTLWPNGQGQLTQVGMKQHYELGQYFRKQYGSLLSKHYFRNETFVRSTDYDRTLMSAQCNMAGLYPPKDWQVWNGSSTNWQPIPIHTDPHDTLLRYKSNNETYKQIIKEIVSSKAYQDLQTQHKEFLEKIGNLTNSTKPLTLRSIWNVQDTLYCEKYRNLSLPTWATEEVLKELAVIAGLDLGTMFGGINYQYREKLAPYVAGPLVKQILENMQNWIQKKATYKFIAYSAHDTTVSGLLVAFKAFNWLPPPFAACVILELHEKKANDGSNAYIVRAFYKNSTEAPTPLKLLGCDFDCPLPQLINLTNSITSDQVAVPKEPSSTLKHAIGYVREHYLEAMLVTVVVLLMVTWTVCFVRCCRSRKPKHDADYQPLRSYDDGKHSV